jgi:hypothetical protein
MPRETIRTEDPNGSVMTIDTLDDDCGSTHDRKAIRLWSASFDYLGRWCFDCKRFHHA